MAETEDTPMETTELPIVSELNLDALPAPTHHWVDRGLVWSCETTAHPYHVAGKRRTPMQQ